MTIAIASARETTLASAGLTNSPWIAWDSYIASGPRVLSTEGGTAASDGSPENAVTGQTWNYWKATPDAAATEVSFQIVFGANRNADFCGLVNHNLGTLGATVTFRRSTNSGSSWTTIATVDPSDDSAIGLLGVADAADYYDVQISGITDADEVQIANILVGTVLIPPRRLYKGYRPPLTPTEVDLTANRSEGGHLLGAASVSRGSTASWDIMHLPKATGRGEEWTDWQRHFNSGGGFFWAWRPDDFGDIFWCQRSGAALAVANSMYEDLMTGRMEFWCFHE